MQKLLFPTLFLLLFAAACSNDFNVNAPWKEIPVTYAVLDATADVQYIRVEKAFIGDQSALKIAKIADSLYYPAGAIEVFLDRMSDTSKTASIVKSLPATRVDGVAEGITRDTGIFATQPNWLYKVITSGNDSLVLGANYQVRIVRKDGKPTITGRTNIPVAFRWADPLAGNIYGAIIPKLPFDTAGHADIAWRTDVNGVYFDIDLDIRYRDADPVTNQTLANNELHWAIVRNKERNETSSGTTPPLTYKGTFETSSLFEFLNKNVEPSTTMLRYFQDMTLTLTGGGREIKIFNQSLSANSGITSAEVISLYSNMSEGFGIVTAKNTIFATNMHLFNETIKDIRAHYLTKNLNFQL